MKQVETIKGPISVDSLGQTLMHEHVFVLTPDIQQNYETEFGDEQTRIDQAVDRLDALYKAGISTIVDLTVVGLGRFIPRIQKIADRTEINIITATGLYTYNDPPLFFHFRGPNRLLGGEEKMIEMFIRDIEVGIDDTGVKAAILKCATDEPGVTPGVERVLRAVARAQLATDVPISTHTFAHGEVGLAQQKIFAEEGVDLSKVIIGHSGDTTDLDYLRKLIDAGSYIGMDRFGIDILLPFEQRVDTVAKMCELGYAEKMVLSHDYACHNDWLDDAVVENVTPNWHYLHIVNDVIPALKARGVSDSDIQTMMIDNPRKIFSA
ncbi:MAG: phosphotriesterase [Acidimicrobiaceae bacterium]|nr:phosphotriesterase [Acidimicrobiaceae bacterium]